MHFYKRNIGDYAKKTGRLTFIQHGAYTLLMDACYDRERFPTLDEAYEWTWAISDEEKAAVEFVLNRYFTLEDGRYIQNRIQEEVTDYNGKALKNQQIAVEREAKRRQQSTTRTRTVNEPPPNHKPLTINQEPRTINQEPLTNKKQKHNTTAASSPGATSLEAEACQVLKRSGIGSVNPQHPELIALCQAGAKPPDFQEAGRIAVDKGKGFAYALGIVKSKLVEKNTETPYQKSVRERVAEFAPGVVKQPIEVINVIAA